MPSVYRYSPSCYNESLLALGNIRIGTLYDFRKSEHREGISDPQEGKKRVSHYIESASGQDSDGLDMRAVRSFGVFEGTENATFSNIYMVNEYDQPDCFIHCTSISYGKDAMLSLNGADSCVEIFDHRGFYRRLTESLSMHAPVKFEILAEVKYTDRDQFWNGSDWGEHPSLIKEPIYSQQKELRAIWSIRGSLPIQPLIINDIGLLKFCRRRDVPIIG